MREYPKSERVRKWERKGERERERESACKRKKRQQGDIIGTQARRKRSIIIVA